MALWNINPGQDHDVYTVVYLLRDALRSALADAAYFERAAPPKARIEGAGHAELAARVGRFRDACQGLREREALMLTKLLRARLWASELRRLAGEIQPEIDQFIDATLICEDLQAEFVRDAHRMFNGGSSAWRFLSQRKPQTVDASDQAASAGQDYLVGGRIALFELRAACEVFLSQIDEMFFADAPSAAPALSHSTALLTKDEAAPSDAPALQ